MRGILKSVGIVAIAIYLTQQIIPTIKISTLNVFIILSGLIFLVQFIIGPLTKILFFLPEGFLLSNLAQIIGNFAILFLVSKSTPELQIEDFNFGGLSSFGIIVPAFNLTSVQTMVLGAVLISLIHNFLNWLVD